MYIIRLSQGYPLFTSWNACRSSVHLTEKRRRQSGAKKSSSRWLRGYLGSSNLICWWLDHLESPKLHCIPWSNHHQNQHGINEPRLIFLFSSWVIASNQIQDGICICPKVQGDVAQWLWQFNGTGLNGKLIGLNGDRLNMILNGKLIGLWSEIMVISWNWIWRDLMVLNIQVREILPFIQIWLVVWNMAFMTFHSVENNNPNWRTHIFQRGRFKPPTSYHSSR